MQKKRWLLFILLSLLVASAGCYRNVDNDDDGDSDDDGGSDDDDFEADDDAGGPPSYPINHDP